MTEAIRLQSINQFGGGQWNVDANGNIAPDAGNVPGVMEPARISANGGTAHVVGDYALSGGWGTTASLALVLTPDDMRGIVDVTSAGTGQGANPTVILTFKDGAFAVAPAVVGIRGDVEATAGEWVVTAQTTTTVTFTFVGTPVAAEVYRLLFHTIG